jgi:hypothetical protein
MGRRLDLAIDRLKMIYARLTRAGLAQLADDVRQLLDDLQHARQIPSEA